MTDVKAALHAWGKLKRFLHSSGDSASKIDKDEWPLIMERIETTLTRYAEIEPLLRELVEARAKAEQSAKLVDNVLGRCYKEKTTVPYGRLQRYMSSLTAALTLCANTIDKIKLDGGRDDKTLPDVGHKSSRET